MLTLIQNAEIYSPAHLGRGDVLLEGTKIVSVAPHLDLPLSFPDLHVVDGAGKKLVPGFIDLHVHIIGGGGEDGFSSRAPESRLTDFTTSGVTTVLGLLGTDGIARSLETLYAKAKGLTEEGITCYMLTGSYGYPSATLTGDVERDMVLIDRCMGAKIAISDHRSSEITYDELLRLATAVRRGGLLGKKAGLLTIHMGDGRENLNKLFRAAQEAEVPLTTFLPTHVARNPDIFRESIRWIKAGGQADFTAGEPTPGGTARFMAQAVRQGADPARMTLSSDAFGSQPRFDEHGNCIGLCYTTSSILRDELVNLVTNEGFSLEQALPFLTENPARVLRLSGTKGRIAPGSDADLLLLEDDLSVHSVYAMGQPMIEDHSILIKGRFE